MKQLAIAAAAALLLVGNAQAQQQTRPMGPGLMGIGSGLYGEVGYTGLQFKNSGIEPDLGMIRGIIGVDVHPNVAVEGMLGFGINDDDTRIGAANVNTEMRNAYGVFIKPKVQFGQAEAFARVGYNRIKVRSSVSVPGLAVGGAESDGDVAYGFGLNYNFSPRAYAGIDWMRYYKDSGIKLDGVTVGLGYRF